MLNKYIEKRDTKRIFRFMKLNIFLKPKWLFKYNFKNNNKALIQEDILVAIGIIMNPISSKNKTLIEIFIKTEINE